MNCKCKFFWLVKVVDFENQVKDFEHKIHDMKIESDKKTYELRQHEIELQRLQQKIIEVKRDISEYGSRILSMGLQIKQLEAYSHKSAVDTERVKSEKMYKQKDIDNKTRSLDILKSKHDREVSEVSRLKTEDLRLETEIKILEQKVR